MYSWNSPRVTYTFTVKPWLFIIATVILGILKVTGVIAVSWWVVFAPVLVFLGLVTVSLTFIILMAILAFFAILTRR